MLTLLSNLGNMETDLETEFRSGSLKLRRGAGKGAGAGGVGATEGGDGLLGVRSSVGPERILANDMGSAALAGF